MAAGSSGASAAKGQSPTHIDRACLDLGDQVDAARAGRRFVETELVRRDANDLVDDAALVAAELLANALQHGKAPIHICVSGDARRVRIEVRDLSPRIPI